MARVVFWVSLILLVLIAVLAISYPKEDSNEDNFGDAPIGGNDSQNVENDSLKKLEGFDFIYSFGIDGEVNYLDTTNDTYVKLICSNGSSLKTYSFSLNYDEMVLVQEATIQNNLLNINKNFDNCEGHMVSPLQSSTLKLNINNTLKTIKWKGCYYNFSDSELLRYHDVEKVINDLIAKKERELSIPPSTCIYL